MALSKVVVALLLVNSAFAVYGFDQLCIDNPGAQFFRHPSDCTKFIQCSNGVAYQKQCAANLHFNPNFNGCDFPSNANCLPAVPTMRPTTQTTLAVPKSNTGEISGDQLCIDNPGAQYLRHPSDCNKYIQCSHGRAFIMSCPANLHFFLSFKGCGFPSNSNCIPAVPTSRPTTAAPKLNGDQLCLDNPEAQYLRHPSDCNKYIQCANGIAYQMQCPENLHFNPSFNGCDYPSNVNCLPAKPTMKTPIIFKQNSRPTKTPKYISIPPMTTEDYSMTTDDIGMPTMTTEESSMTTDDNGMPTMTTEESLMTTDDIGMPTMTTEENSMTTDDNGMPTMTTEESLMTTDDNGMPTMTTEESSMTTDNNGMPTMTTEESSMTTDDIGMPTMTTEESSMTTDNNGMPAMTTEESSMTTDDIGMPTMTTEESSMTTDNNGMPTMTTEESSMTTDDIGMPAMTTEESSMTTDDIGMPTMTTEESSMTTDDIGMPTMTTEENSMTTDDIGMPTMTTEESAMPTTQNSSPLPKSMVMFSGDIHQLCRDQNRPNGFYRHPFQSHKFIQCISPFTVIEKCPFGFEYDHAPQDPMAIPCRRKAGMTPSGIDVKNLCKVFKLPEELIYPHPSRCDQFIQCSNGITHEMNCAQGTLFDSLNMICDHTYNVDCNEKDNFYKYLLQA